MEFVDRQLSCLDCGQPFTFTAGEQEFYERKGFKEEPKRCKSCRDARKARRDTGEPGGPRRATLDGAEAQGVAPPIEDDIGNRVDARPAVSAPRGGSRSGARELFDATCAQCGAATKVPFRPAAGRPVYCRDCFANRRGVGS